MRGAWQQQQKQKTHKNDSKYQTLHYTQGRRSIWFSVIKGIEIIGILSSKWYPGEEINPWRKSWSFWYIVRLHGIVQELKIAVEHNSGIG